ncbi:MAG: L,D-transpeptidase family protein [Actinomycetota bacterium]
MLAGAATLALLVAGCTDASPGATPTQVAPTQVAPTTAVPTTSIPTEPPQSPPPAPSPTTPSPTTPSPTTSSPSPEPTSDALERGDEGPAVLALQEQLAELGYWLGRPDGTFGHLTEQAVFALQGAAGLTRDGVVGPLTRAALEAGVLPSVRSSSGSVVEIDLDAGTLTFAEDGAPRRVLHTSTGTFKPYTYEGRELLADTPRGEWEVTWAYDGWRTSPLGRLYRPRYFHPDGVAVHGYTSVPAYPASHGCARVSIAAMDMIWREGLMPRGMPVLVY